MTPGYSNFVYFYWPDMPFLAQTLDNADPLFALVIAPGFYLHHVGVADKNIASGDL